MDSPAPAPPTSPLKPWLDLGPLLVFFAVNWKWGLIAATAVLVPLSVASLVAGWKLTGRVPRFTLYATVAVVVFGGLTVALRDPTFVKVKLTVVYALFGTVLGIGLLRGKSLLGEVLGEGLRLTDAGWRTLTLRFTFFFYFLAALNEILRRVLSDTAWVNFKVFGGIGATMLFMALQAPLVSKHSLEERRE